MSEVVLITGAHGFLGKAVARAVEERTDGSLVLKPTRQELDLSDAMQVRHYWRTHRPTQLIHLGAFARGLGGNLEARENAFLLNEALVRAPLLAALEFGVQDVFFAGTVAEYGYPYSALPLRESMCLDCPPHSGENYYALAKRGAQVYLEAIRDRWGTRVVHGLLTNMYGPGDRYDPVGGHVVAAMLVKFSRAVASSQNVVSLWGFPDTTRDFMHSEDVARCIVQLLGQNTGRINIGTGVATSMGDVAQAIAGGVGYRGSTEWDSSKPVGIEHRVLDISRLNALVSFEARDFQTGIRQTISADGWPMRALADRLVS